MENRWGNNGNSETLFFWAPKSLQMVTTDMNVKDAPWKKGYEQPRQHIKKQRITLPTKVHLVKAMVFPVVMYRYESWTIKKAEHQRTDAFELWCWKRLLRVWTVVLEKTLESPLDCKETQAVNPKGNQSWKFIERLMLKLKLQHFGHLMWRTDSLEKTLMLGKIEGRRRRGW